MLQQINVFLRLRRNSRIQPFGSDEIRSRTPIKPSTDDAQETEGEDSSLIIRLRRLLFKRELWEAIDEKTIIYPHSPFFLVWNYVIHIAVIYTVWSIPFLISLGMNKMMDQNKGWIALDIFCTICFIANLVINFRFVRTEYNEYITDASLIATAYLKGWLIADVLAAIPYFLFYGDHDWTTYLVALRLFQVIKLFSINKLDIWNSTSTFQRLYVLTIQFIFLSHIVGCLYILIARVQDFSDNKFIPGSELVHKTPGSKYLYGVAWSSKAICSFGTLVRPVTDAEFLLVILVAISGVFVMGSFVGSMTSAIESLQQSQSRYVDKLMSVDEYLNYRQLPLKTKERVQKHYQKVWLINRGVDESSILASLPKDLRAEVALHLRRDLIQKLHLFKDASEGFIRELSMKLYPALYELGDFVFQQGDIGNEMYFIQRGTVEIIAPDNQTVVAQLFEGAYFGEIALLTDTSRTASVRCIEPCELYILRKKDLDPLLQLYPDVARKVHEIARAREKTVRAVSSVVPNKKEDE